MRYTALGVQKTFPLWDGHDFFAYCDDGTEVSVDETVMMVPEKERYITESVWSWTLTDILDEDVFYFHQYRVLVDIQTVGIHPLDASNHVECEYRTMHWMEIEDLYRRQRTGRLGQRRFHRLHRPVVLPFLAHGALDVRRA